jgi:hypothetical protein
MDVDEAIVIDIADSDGDEAVITKKEKKLSPKKEAAPVLQV